MAKISEARPSVSKRGRRAKTRRGRSFGDCLAALFMPSSCSCKRLCPTDRSARLPSTMRKSNFYDVIVTSKGSLKTDRRFQIWNAVVDAAVVVLGETPLGDADGCVWIVKRSRSVDETLDGPVLFESGIGVAFGGSSGGGVRDDPDDSTVGTGMREKERDERDERDERSFLLFLAL
ncbi:hypothetical protein KPH14_001524 [Odynerus spinipes]|uniref:Uncharacterized protein n=1 Tax=Odynerus spinipes TaxID=1348599 RepID=A0AAD9RVM2_9HYME|nr:hypothetical protein KPH14_001524 [Odynerus spinipes]